ncbi:MAG: DUF6106 family protein [Candidatus Limivivens sp.]|nr:DUF6106 family protein [Candidatus Limivivens sp.]
MSELYVELLVKRKKTAKDTMLKVLLIAGIVLTAFAGLFIHPLALLLTVVLGVVAYFKMPSLDLEFEYLYVNGELDVDKIMSKVKRKRVGSFDIEKADLVAPWKSHELDYYRQSKDIKILDYSSGEENANVYAMVTKDDKGMKIVLFEPNEAILNDMRRISPRKVKLS